MVVTDLNFWWVYRRMYCQNNSNFLSYYIARFWWLSALSTALHVAPLFAFTFQVQTISTHKIFLFSSNLLYQDRWFIKHQIFWTKLSENPIIIVIVTEFYLLEPCYARQSPPALIILCVSFLHTYIYNYLLHQVIRFENEVFQIC